MRVSLEAVARSREALAETAAAAAKFPQISVINVADILRFPLRPWDACGILANFTAAGRGASPAPHLMPHIRAIDFDLSEPFPHRDLFRGAGIRHALVIAGDPPQDKTRLTYPTETEAFIRKLKTEMPELRIYAAFDPYRYNIRRELEYMRAKEEAGAEGFMSQPFFDLRLLEIYAEYLEGKEIFWGLTPVLSAASRNYWESRNRAVFPKAFRPTMEWNAEFGRRVLDFCGRNQFNLYLMPIKGDLLAYLGGLFGGGRAV
ncbi:MAG: methylenetetrahydrofolate reductase [Treponema sp.]|jgi:methylenetetrahydrofolate reductase (NADPH)|nr:methylenetetrahydrofolate reductase [Treponema sp.]